MEPPLQALVRQVSHGQHAAADRALHAARDIASLSVPCRHCCCSPLTAGLLTAACPWSRRSASTRNTTSAFTANPCQRRCSSDAPRHPPPTATAAAGHSHQQPHAPAANIFHPFSPQHSSCRHFSHTSVSKQLRPGPRPHQGPGLTSDAARCSSTCPRCVGSQSSSRFAASPSCASCIQACHLGRWMLAPTTIPARRSAPHQRVGRPTDVDLSLATPPGRSWSQAGSGTCWLPQCLPDRGCSCACIESAPSQTRLGS